MISKSVYPDGFTYPFVLTSCSRLDGMQQGRKIHGFVIKLGLDLDDSVGTALLKMYRDGGNFDLINKMPVNSWSKWNCLNFEGFQDGNPAESFRIFEQMRAERLEPNLVDVINLLRASSELKSLKLGKLVHSFIVMSNLNADLTVNTALLTMYSKLGSLETARLLFDQMLYRDCVLWNIMISAYSRNGNPEESIKLLKQMGRLRIRADLFTALAAISSIAEIKSVEFAKQMHAHIFRNGSDYQVSVHNSLIDMYCKCNHLEAAKKIFDLLTNKTLISWSSMIKGYVSHNQFSEALFLFNKMRSDGLKLDSVTVINILPACVNMGVLEEVKHLHGYCIRYGLNTTISVSTALIVSYAKCGCIDMARKLFHEEEREGKDLITWNSMISAYSKHGDWSQTFELYSQMKRSNLKPDEVTFLGLLTACVNSGFVEKGREYFNEMIGTFNCQPKQEHYACMVDLLGRNGYINEAMNLIKSMPFKPDAKVWGPLLSACKVKSETHVAEFAAEKLINMEPKNAGNYILLSNIYAAAGKWDGVAKMRTFLRDSRLKKVSGYSWLDVNGRVHEFRVADKSHPNSNEIYRALGTIEWEIKEGGDMSLEMYTFS